MIFFLINTLPIEKKHYLCIVDVIEDTQQDVRTPNLQSDHQVSGEVIRVDYPNLISETIRMSELLTNKLTAQCQVC